MKTAYSILLCLLGLDLVVLLAAWGPSLMGYIGPESYEWVTLKIGVCTIICGVLLLMALGAVAGLHAFKFREQGK